MTKFILGLILTTLSTLCFAKDVDVNNIEPFGYIITAGDDIERDINEIQCLADNIYFEARGEGIEGWKGVANVVYNRVQNESFPTTICQVVKQKKRNICQFSWFCDKRLKNKTDHRPSNLYQDIVKFAAQFYVKAVYFNKRHDNTKNSIFYHAKQISVNDLGLSATTKLSKPIRINNHVFYGFQNNNTI